MDLNFDKMSVDTSLARDYLQSEHDGQGRAFDTSHYKLEDLPSYLKELVIKLKENKNLIAQLEYVVREIPIADTIVQLDLIIQQINYVSFRAVRETRFAPLPSNMIILRSDSPLLLLGNIAKTMQNGNTCAHLQHDDKTKPICTLIANLCQSIKLPVFTIAAEKDVKYLGVYQAPKGTAAVISENSDVESAVDILLASSKHVPWRLQRILVQESVYQQFQSALSWKSKLNKQEKSDSASSDVFEYNGRVFLLDFASFADLNPQTVTIEAYRTRKELKLLLNQYRPHYLSLWANDISEINEIAYSISSPVVWVNNFGDFRGPPKITEALFYHDSESKTINVNGLQGLKDAWSKLDLETRRGILCKALDECTHKSNISFDDIKGNLQKIDINAQSAFVDVGSNYVCVGISAPSNRLFYRRAEFYSTQLFVSVLHGNAFVLSSHPNNQIVDIFKKAGIPVIWAASSNESTNSSVVYDCDDGFPVEFTQSTKVIWTNSGTVFAN